MSDTKQIAKQPKRRKGRERVESLLDGAVAVFGERGYGAATMTEIAARAGAPIGSLYQFFPSKESLVDALVERYGTHLHERLDRVRERAPGLSAGALAEALLSVFVDLSRERSLVVSLLDASWQQPEQRPGRLRHAIRQRIVEILTIWHTSTGSATPIAPDEAEVHAIVILQALKGYMQLCGEQDSPTQRAAIAAWKRMLETYVRALTD